MAYYDKHLYAGFMAYDPDPTKIPSSLILTTTVPSSLIDRFKRILEKTPMGGKAFNEYYLHFFSEVKPSGSVSLWLSGTFGDQIDHVNVQDGSRVRLSPGVRYNLGRQLYIGLYHVFERLNVEAGKLYTAKISNILLVYQFNRRTFLRTLLQYADYKYNTDLYTSPRDPRYKHLFS